MKFTKHHAKSYSYYVIVNGVYVASLYYGFFKNMEGAANIALFISWLFAVIGTLTVMSKDLRTETIKKQLDKEYKYFPVVLDVSFDIAVLGLFIFMGYIWLPIFLVLALTGSMVQRQEFNEWKNKTLIEKLKGNMVET